jgi:hypothetical protein
VPPAPDAHGPWSKSERAEANSAASRRARPSGSKGARASQEYEHAVLEGDRLALATPAGRLARVPTPAGPTPEQLGTDRAFVSLTTVQDGITGDRP